MTDRGEMEISEVLMTPADAARLLENNTINRKLSRQRAAVLTAAINQGEWRFDGNPVKIADDGTVIDGQHRLRAIADAGTGGVPLILITGMASEARLVTDSGRSRSFADYLDIQGVPNSQSMAAVTRGVWNYSHGLHDWHGDWMKRPLPSHLHLWELYENRRSSLERAVSQANAVIRVVRASRSSVGTAWIVLGDVECDRCGPVQDDLEEFYEQLMMRSTASDAAMAFIKVMNQRGASAGEKPGRSVYTHTDQLALLLKAWNGYREGRPLTRLTFQRGGQKPEKFPVPH